SNAIKYSPDGGDVVVDVSQEVVSGKAEAVLAVRDQGIGIPAEDVPRLFERFFRASNVNGRLPGVGLGLAGARQIVEQHGGTIEVTSALGKGTTFTVRLPLFLADTQGPNPILSGEANAVLTASAALPG
ncbi:MAG TPA: ATP-binding protein, partial [Chloroflexota bacterium]|nr:ATP-binding protein [Chloroflexota bacterium]